MALSDFVAELDQLAAQAQEAFDAASSQETLEAARIEFLGAKSGRLKATQKQMGKVDKADKPAAGKRLNEVKQAIEEALPRPVSVLLQATLPAVAMWYLIPRCQEHRSPSADSIPSLKRLMS